MKRSYTTIWIALAFVLACKELQRRSGVAAASWAKELREKAYLKLSLMSDRQLLAYINKLSCVD